jgi:hypothetical protein
MWLSQWSKTQPKAAGFRDSVRHHRSWLTVALFGADAFRDDRVEDDARTGGAPFGWAKPTRELYLSGAQDDTATPYQTAQG